MGAASEGGYLGADAQSFLSAVVSGAAGAYFVTLMGDAGIGTDLTIQPGQDVRIIGDLGLIEAPSWGGGGFTVREGGSLSLTNVGIQGTISVLNGGRAAVHGGNLALISGDVDVSLSTTLALNRQCYEPFQIVNDLWRAASAGFGRHSDCENAGVNSGEGTAAYGPYSTTGVGEDNWYRFTGPGGDALPLLPPGGDQCGTHHAGWLSGWPDPDAPDRSYSGEGRYPTVAEGVVEMTVCFDGPEWSHHHGHYTCYQHTSVAVVRCDEFLLWRLPSLPCEDWYRESSGAAAGYCTVPSGLETSGAGR